MRSHYGSLRLCFIQQCIINSTCGLLQTQHTQCVLNLISRLPISIVDYQLPNTSENHSTATDPGIAKILVIQVSVFGGARWCRLKPLGTKHHLSFWFLESIIHPLPPAMILRPPFPQSIITRDVSSVCRRCLRKLYRPTMLSRHGFSTKPAARQVAITLGKSRGSFSKDYFSANSIYKDKQGKKNG